MKLITEVQDDKELLARLYASAEIVSECIEEAQIMEIRKRKPANLPKIGPKDAAGVKAAKQEQIHKMIAAQAKENIMDMLKNLMVKNPECSIRLLQSLIILDEGEEFPSGMKLFSTAVRAFLNPDVLDFFTSLMQLEHAL